MDPSLYTTIFDQPRPPTVKGSCRIIAIELAHGSVMIQTVPKVRKTPKIYHQCIVKSRGNRGPRLKLEVVSRGAD